MSCHVEGNVLVLSNAIEEQGRAYDICITSNQITNVEGISPQVIENIQALVQGCIETLKAQLVEGQEQKTNLIDTSDGEERPAVPSLEKWKFTILSAEENPQVYVEDQSRDISVVHLRTTSEKVRNQWNAILPEQTLSLPNGLRAIRTELESSRVEGRVVRHLRRHSVFDDKSNPVRQPRVRSLSLK